MKGRRQERVNEMLKRHISSVLVGDVKDPRVGFVTVIKAEISEDGRDALVLVTLLDEDEKVRKSCMKALNEMKGFFQKGLSKIIGLRVTPVLTFRLDKAANRAYKLDALISKARESDIDHQEDAPLTENEEDS
jgi:ribosome-binding factor A